jgi:hypothetical protein
MSEMNPMSCREFHDVAAELALGVLTGRERAQAIAHLDTCEACRESVRQLTLTGEGLVGLLPSLEPPAGFETRVLDRIGLAAPAPSPARQESWRSRFGRKPAAPGQLSRTRRMLAVAAVALAVVAGGLGGWGLHNGNSSAPPAALNTAALVSVSHHAVGKIFLYRGHPQWLYMSVNMGSGNGTVICQIESRSGQITTLGAFHLINGYGYWGSPATGSSGPLKGARLVTAGGKILATATFPAA